MAKNHTLLSGITNRVVNASDDGTERSPPRAKSLEPFSANLEGVTNPRAPGQPDAKILKTAIQRQVWVDPASCRPWDHHNRAYELLDEQRCADLIAGFRSLGRQQRPALVRSLVGDRRVSTNGLEHDFEIISGARRHWTVSWFRSNTETNSDNEPYLFLVVVRDDIDNTQAFELSDAENRGQDDISDYERAREYRWALENLYDSNVSKMAEAIQMDRSQLTRLIALTEMPDIVVKAYPTILDIRLHHWRQLAPYFSSNERLKKDAAERVLACASSIVDARASRNRSAPDDGAKTASMLLQAIKEKARGGDRTQVLETLTATATGRRMLTVKRTTRGIVFDVPTASGATKDEIQEALRRAVESYFSG